MASSRKDGAAKKPKKAQRPAKRALRSTAAKELKQSRRKASTPPTPPPTPAEPAPMALAEPEPIPSPAPPSGESMTSQTTSAPSAAPEPAPAPASPPPEPAAPPPQWAPVTEPANAPAPPPPPSPATQWVSVPTDSTAAPTAPADTAEDLRIQHATNRRGVAFLTAVGTLLAMLGLVVMIYAFYAGKPNGELPRPAGIRGDYIGVVLLLIGVAIATTFLFVPKRRPFGLGPNPAVQDIEAEASRSRTQLRTVQTLVGIGVGLIGLGLVWMLYWMYRGYMASDFRSSIIRGYEIPTHYFGAVFILLGLLLTLYCWGGVAGARRRHNLSVVMLTRAPTPPAGTSTNPAALSSGVTEQEVQNLMKRLDSLMSQLPDTAVTEFSKTPEADTYLKLLGS